MSEVTFAKAFLVTLDKKAIKLPADHVSDPRKYPSQSPYIVPKQSHPYPKKDVTQLATGEQSKTITISIKPMRGGSAVTISDVSIEDTVHDVKGRYAQQTSQSLDKIKLLINKKPVAELKTLRDLGIAKDVDMTAMVMGGAALEQSPSASHPTSTPPAQTTATEDDKMEIDSGASHPGSEKAQVQAGEAGTQAVAGTGVQDVLKTDEFWSDLEGFLSQRLRDQDEATRLAKLFKKAASTS